MKKLIVILIIIIFAIGYFYFNNNHHTCNWEDCPVNKDYKKYSDGWCIKQIHLDNPGKSYEECEYIFNMDSKDVTIN